MSKQQISCPQCGHSMDVNDILYHQLNEQVQKEYSGKLSTLEKQQQKLDEAITEGVRKKLQSEKSAIEKKLRAEISGENAEAIHSLEEQLEEKSKEVKEHNKLKSELAKVKREKDGLKEQIEAEAQQTINETVADERTKIRNQVEHENEMKIAEKDTIISRLKEDAKQMQRKIEQGSQQLTGEVQEIAVEEYLKRCFPGDDVQEIKKGQRGADCLHVIILRTGFVSGSIYYESKRTREFSSAWIPKFKDDMRLKGATIGAIITDVYPKGVERMSQIDGVWVISYPEFLGLAHLLRQAVIMYHDALSTQENKGEKMSMLYDYLCGTEFQREITAIVEAFSQMSNELQSEQRSMSMMWKKRQKQIDKVLQSTIHMYGSIKGIAGNAIQTIPALELPTPDKDAV
ncbi:MAG TPA: DUF2130 domain-containing protein [Bacteroidia bacterium]|jgi:hypothetical protein|nr:DUF2130 domain-containing protein [Bacteroidia bacterium]